MSAPEIATHYARDQPIDRILGQLVASGHDLEHLEHEALAGVDEFHLGGRRATMALLDSLALTADSRVLDVGCGIGGAARTMAAMTACHVTGVDLTPEFVTAARELSELVGLADRTDFEVGDAMALSFADEAFDAVTVLHVGMNIADKAALFTDLARLLRPGGSLHVYDIMRVGDGEIEYPMPWSTGASTSFVDSPGAYADAMQEAGLATGEPVDRLVLVQQAMAAAAENRPSVDLSHLMGEEWPIMFGNMRAAIEAGIVSPIELVARRPV